MSGPAIHPVADLFPVLSAEDLQSLADDIAERGLLHPIVTDADGLVLDGRNRLAACKLAKFKPTFVTYDGDDPAGYVLAANIERRHLSKGQAAMLAAKVWAVSAQTQRQAAAKAGVSKARITQAAAVLDHAPDLAPKVIAGTTSLDEAYAQAQETKARADAITARNETLDRAISLLEEYGTYPDRVADLIGEYAPLYPSNPITGERLNNALDGLEQINKGWPT
jgi:ParB-like chromosome segregation protein Spo0J